MDIRAGFGYDSHRLEEGRKLIIGGVEIPYHKGPIAHSDGDALMHAICDALLGAAGLQDIGTQFPDNDLQYKNMDSKILLSKTKELLLQHRWRINNMDATVVLEAPKLAPFKEKIKETLAELLAINNSRIAIKAKTNEKMGDVGSGNGIVVFAVVTLVREY
ncbi:MAG: 2-C-methyl-D-erythritol 2,4-cyclodiphosphate synthase [Bacteroidales bacterium]|nr:2-C-methyl-D-erythritol 2,4-cyclodiphosphate synthase [Bacteroidales bacterium]